MTRAAKVTLLAVVLVVLAFTLHRLRHYGTGHGPAASISDDAGSDTPAPGSANRVRQQPTILDTRPALGGNGYSPHASPRYDERPPDSPIRSLGEVIPETDLMSHQYEQAVRPVQDPTWSVSKTLQGIRWPFAVIAGEGDPAARDQPPLDGGLETLPPLEEPDTFPPLPEIVATQANDSFWSISQRVYGVGDYYRALYYHNRERVPRPDMIMAGIQISTPSPEQLRRLYPELCPEPETR